jgi:hypothetical protein
LSVTAGLDEEPDALALGSELLLPHTATPSASTAADDTASALMEFTGLILFFVSLPD